MNQLQLQAEVVRLRSLAGERSVRAMLAEDAAAKLRAEVARLRAELAKTGKL